MKKGLLICFSLLMLPMFLLASHGMLHNKVFKSSIKNHPPGDTIIFKASNYVIQPNDKLDDLLKRIPTISVDKNGIFYSQGQKIEMFLVDGQEFFTNDISVGARQLRADEVDKLVIYWRWSEQSSFTGIEDNTKKFKVLNVVMKKQPTNNKK